MKVLGPGRIQPARIRGSERSHGAGGDFARHLVDDAAAPGASAPARPVQAVNPLLALQEVPDALHARKRAVRRGQELLERLDSLRHALLTGRLTDEILRRLADEVTRERPLVSDPGLQQVLDEIEIRAQVELAKRGLA
ncbi:MAG: flagellar assembly protein FliX [Alphaproteobacteria bacterium]|nr:flagellar assembly protein FliX [Alphaproteobacteria bacterium]